MLGIKVARSVHPMINLTRKMESLWIFLYILCKQDQGNPKDVKLKIKCVTIMQLFLKVSKQDVRFLDDDCFIHCA